MVQEGSERPTQFEMLTAAAFWYFKAVHVEYAVIEVGLGGLLDSTNVITPVLSVITNVAMDHMAYCGNTIEEIAAQKAGIIKEGVPVVTTAEGVALSVIAREAYAKHSRLYALNHSFDVVGNAGPEDPAIGQMVTVREKFGFAVTATIPLLGKHQRTNCAAAAMALLLIAHKEKKLTRTALEEGLHRVKWPGRFEVVHAGGHDVVIDGAHNPDGITSFCQTYEDVFATRKRVFLFPSLLTRIIPIWYKSYFDRMTMLFVHQLLRRALQILRKWLNSFRAVRMQYLPWKKVWIRPLLLLRAMPSSAL